MYKYRIYLIHLFFFIFYKAVFKVTSKLANLPWQTLKFCYKRRTLPNMVSQMLQNSTTCTFIFDNLYLFSTTYIYIQHFIFIFNNTHFLSTSTKILFIQQKYLFYFNRNDFHSKKIIIQLLPRSFSFNNNICSTSTTIIFIQQ